MLIFLLPMPKVPSVEISSLDHGNLKELMISDDFFSTVVTAASCLFFSYARLLLK